MDAAARRPDTQSFAGTLAEIAAAIDAGTQDPADLPLARLVAGASADAVDLDAAVSTLVLLASLIERKARALLPEPPAAEDPEPPADPEEEAAALAARLAAYEAFAEAAQALRAFEGRRRTEFGRPALAVDPGSASAAAVQGGGARAPEAEEVPGRLLEPLLHALAEVWARAAPRTTELARPQWTVAAAAEALRRRLRRAGSAEFTDLFPAGADRLEVVVAFLALLELVRQGEVAVEQDGPFAAVRISWTGTAPAARRQRRGAGGDAP